MIRLSLIKFFLLATIISLFLVPTIGKADCDLEKTSISLKLLDMPIKDILKKIEEQTKYTINVDNIKALNSKKSIVLNQSPLNKALHRIFKDINYSIICNEKQKILTLVFLDKSNLPSSTVSARINTDESLTHPMDGIDTAFEEYNSKRAIQALPSPQDQEETSMDGATAAFEEYNSNVRQTDLEQQEETSMDGATAAFEEYNSNVKQADLEQQEETSMDGATAAFEEYKNKDTQIVSAPLDQEKTSMDGVSAAFEEYKRLQAPIN